jgi:hypothetical protein
VEEGGKSFGACQGWRREQHRTLGIEDRVAAEVGKRMEGMDDDEAVAELGCGGGLGVGIGE